MKRLLFCLLGLSLLPTCAVADVIYAARVTTDSATYELREKPYTKDGSACIVRNGVQMMCLGAGIEWFGKTLKTKDYTVVTVYDASGGNAAGDWSTLTLVIEHEGTPVIYAGFSEYNGAEAAEKALVKYEENEIVFPLHRVGAKSEIAARFKDGSVMIGKAELESNEPLSANDCEWLYGQFLDGCINESAVIQRGTRCVGMIDRMAMVYVRSIAGIANEYANLPQSMLEGVCDRVCSTGVKPIQSQFKKTICRQ